MKVPLTKKIKIPVLSKNGAQNVMKPTGKLNSSVPKGDRNYTAKALNNAKYNKIPRNKIEVSQYENATRNLNKAKPANVNKKRNVKYGKN